MNDYYLTPDLAEAQPLDLAEAYADMVDAFLEQASDDELADYYCRRKGWRR